jgi:hypothetical protein
MRPSVPLSRRELQRQAFFAKWNKIDWTKQDIQLAAEIKLSRERIRQIRLRLGAPKSPHHREIRKSTLALQWAIDNQDKLLGLSQAEITRKYGLRMDDRSGALYQFIKPLLRNGNLFRKHRWDLMNFDLPNHDLERVWNVPRNMLGSYRRRNRRPPPRWPFHGSYPQFTGQREFQAYRRALKAEERYAARHFARA